MINMKFLKGMMVGGLVSAGIVMMCTDSDCAIMDKKKVVKKGKQFFRKMGVLV